MSFFCRAGAKKSAGGGVKWFIFYTITLLVTPFSIKYDYAYDSHYCLRKKCAREGYNPTTRIIVCGRSARGKGIIILLALFSAEEVRAGIV